MNRQTPAAGSTRLELPNGRLASRVLDMVKDESPVYLYNHCLRAYFFADALGRLNKMTYDSETLFIACMMHDLGIVEKFHGKTRFEVDGADAAVKFLVENGANSNMTEVVWDAIALHTTSVIPLRKRAEIALLHIGTSVDIMGQRIGDIAPDLVLEILEAYPRENLKKKLVEDFISYLRENPAGGAGYWLSQIAEKYVEGAPHFNFEKVLNAAPFVE